MSKKTKRKLLSTLFVLGATTTLFASIIPFLKGCNNTKNITIQKNEEEKEKQDNDKKEEQSIDKKNQEIIDDLIRLNRESDDFFEISKQLSNNNYELEQLLEIENKAKDLFIFSAHVNKKITDNQLNKNHFKDLEFAEGKKVLMPIEVEDKKLNTSLENILNEAKKIAKAIVDNKQKISNDQKEVSKEEIDKLNTVTEIIEYLKLKENEENKRPEDEIDLIRLNRESNEIFRTSKNFENEFVISSIETDKREELNENQKEELSKDFGSILDTSLKRLLDFKNEILSKKEDAKNVNEKINKLGKKEEDYEGVEYEESKNVLMPEIVENKWLSESLNTTVETAKKIVNNAIKFNEQDDYENKTIFSDSQKQEIIDIVNKFENIEEIIEFSKKIKDIETFMPSTKNEKLKGTHWRFFSPVSIDELIKGNFSGYNGYYDNNLTAGFNFNELHSYTNKIYELTKKKEEFYNEFISKHINYDKSIQYFFRKKLFHANSIDEVLQLKQEFLETIELKKDVIENYFKPLIIRREGLSEKAMELLQTNRLQQNLFQGLNFVFSKDSINEYKDLLVFLKENKDNAIWDENIKIYKEELPEKNFLNNIFSNTYEEYNKQLIEKSGSGSEEYYSWYIENEPLYYNYYYKYDKMHVSSLSTSGGPDKVILLNNLINLGDKEVIIQNPTAIYKPFINPLFKDYEFKNGEINEFNSTITLFKLLVHQYKPQEQIDNRKYMPRPGTGYWREQGYSNPFIEQIWLNFTHEKVLNMNEWFKNSHYAIENNDYSWWNETLEELSKDTSIKNIHKRHEYLTNWVNKTEFSVENLSSDDIFMEFFISLYSVGEEYGKSDYNKDNLPYKYRDGLPLKNNFPKPNSHYQKQIYRFAKYIDHKINIEENQTVDYIEEW